MDQVVVEVLEVTDHQFLVSHLVEVVLLNHYLQLQFARLILLQSEVVHQVDNHPLHQDHKVMMVVIQYLQTLQPLSHQQVVEVVVHQEMVQPLEDLEDQVDPVAEDLAAQEDLEEHPDQPDSAVAEAEVQTQLLVQDLAETE